MVVANAPYSIGGAPKPRIDRRHLLTGGAALVATPLLSVASGSAQESATIDFDAFRQANLAITGAVTLDDEGLRQLLDLFLNDEEMADALQLLVAEAAAGSDLDPRTLDFTLIVIITNILQFWYLGNFRNQPLPNRPDRILHLVAYRALPYFTVPTICKGFGYWATDPGID